MGGDDIFFFRVSEIYIRFIGSYLNMFIFLSIFFEYIRFLSGFRRFGGLGALGFRFFILVVEFRGCGLRCVVSF